MILLRKVATLGAFHAYNVARNLLPSSGPLRANRRFRNLHRGSRCFILGSGRSILEQDLTRLRGEIVMTQNSFHMHADIATIAPRYHCIVPMFQPPEYATDWLQWFREMQERLPDDTQIFAGLNSRPLFEKNGLFQGRAHYIRAGVEPLFVKRAPFDLTRRIMTIPTALTQCLTVALYLGFERIYLLGFDLSQMCEGHGKNWGRFYGSSPVTRNEAERSFERERDWDGENWFQYWNMWQSFAHLRDEATRQGSAIINATRGGLLDCFPRERYEDLVGA